ncbi:hypothetical protein SBV1_2450006 [Verrucomicrobia bacterium]|nr:hypothetical protein SBV1_2450006 [Verrucomicrobiota bacterium]
MSGFWEKTEKAQILEIHRNISRLFEILSKRREPQGGGRMLPRVDEGVGRRKTGRLFHQGGTEYTDGGPASNA